MGAFGEIDCLLLFVSPCFCLLLLTFALHALACYYLLLTAFVVLSVPLLLRLVTLRLGPKSVSWLRKSLSWAPRSDFFAPKSIFSCVWAPTLNFSNPFFVGNSEMILERDFLQNMVGNPFCMATSMQSVA